MANAYKPDFNNPYRVDPLYVKMTLPRNTNDSRSSLPSVLDIFGKLSVTSQFKVTLYFGDTSSADSDEDVNAWLISCGVLGNRVSNSTTVDNGLRYEFMCNETTLPGSNLSTLEEIGSRQGISETFANRRIFEPITMTFYVDAEYGVIRLFEEWMNFINPLYNNQGRQTQGSVSGQPGRIDAPEFFRFRYPSAYKRDIAVTKFERDIYVDPSLGDVVETPTTLTYYMLNAYPVQLTALPVTYEGSTITKTTVTFNYDRYVLLNNPRNVTGNSSVFQDQRTTNDQQTTLVVTPTVVNSNPAPNNATSNYGVNSGISYP